MVEAIGVGVGWLGGAGVAFCGVGWRREGWSHVFDGSCALFSSDARASHSPLRASRTACSSSASRSSLDLDAGAVRSTIVCGTRCGLSDVPIALASPCSRAKLASPPRICGARLRVKHGSGARHGRAGGHVAGTGGPAGGAPPASAADRAARSRSPPPRPPSARPRPSRSTSRSHRGRTYRGRRCTRR